MSVYRFYPAAVVILALSASCNDGPGGITVHNTPPEVKITNPLDGQQVLEGTDVSARASVSDTKTDAEHLVVRWYIGTLEDEEPICEGEVPTADGDVFCDFTMGYFGDEAVSLKLQATDGDGATEVGGITLSVAESGTPTCTITSPESTLGDSEAVYYADEPAPVVGACEDPESDPEELTVWWTHAHDGGAEQNLAVSGGFAELDEGFHTIYLYGEDPSGKVGVAQVAVEVSPANVLPECEIVQPADSTAGGLGDEVRFEGLVADPDGVTETLLVQWESDLDGLLVESTPVDGAVSASYELDEGTHTISLYVEDDRGGVCTDAVKYTVGGGPSVLIVEPNDGELEPGEPILFGLDESIYFAAEFSDAESDCSELSLEWLSDITGSALPALGVGEIADTDPCQHVFNATLPEGDHVVALWVTDGDGYENMDSVPLTVTDCTQTWYLDHDGDGYGDDGSDGDGAITIEDCTQPDGYVAAAYAGDCDDSNPGMNPGEVEACNGLDDNCNGTLDEGYTTHPWYEDNDGDGWGDTATATEMCDAPNPHWVASDGDCDDRDASYYPGAAETCDDGDDDCDGTIDEGFPYPYGTTWYADGDGDGHGDPAYSQADCTQPSGYVADYTDCDDSDAATNPDEPEYCGGGDEDCDGDVDESGAVDALTWYQDADLDTYGDLDSTAASCDQPAGYVADYTDCDDADTSANPGADERCDGADDDCDGAVDESAVDQASWYLDADGDGYGDPSVSTIACDAPLGYVSNANDCDDTDSGVNPAAIESCDGEDDDCDGVIDNGALLTWYLDSDNDSYGTASSATQSCSQPGGYVSNTSDCDDGDSSVYPGATETCDGDDEDCDGTTDEGSTCQVTDTFVPDDIDSTCPQATGAYGSGDYDFNGNGPSVSIESTFSVGSSSISRATTFTAVETKSDYTGITWSDTESVYSAPSGCTIVSVDQSSGACSYTDTDHSLDYLPSGEGACSGFMASAIVNGDTGGKDIENCNGSDDTWFSADFEQITVTLDCPWSP